MVKWQQVRVVTVVAAALGLLAFLGDGAVAGDAGSKPAARRAPLPAYTIGRGDTLRIAVWKEPELTLDVTVRPDGMVTIPLLGDVEAAGRSPGQLANTLKSELDRLVENPRVTVSVTQATSARI